MVRWAYDTKRNNGFPNSRGQAPRLSTEMLVHVKDILPSDAAFNSAQRALAPVVEWD